MLKLIFSGIACLAASGKYYHYEKVHQDRDFNSFTLKEAQEIKNEGQQALLERVEPWLDSVFRNETIPFIETIETVSPEGYYTSYIGMPVGKEYSQAVHLAQPEFIECLSTQNARKAPVEKALRHYLEKRSEYINALIAQHNSDQQNIIECCYSHLNWGGEAATEILDNGMTYSFIGLDFCHSLKKSPVSEKHGYLADLMIRLIKDSQTTQELTVVAEKLAQEDFNIEAATLLHEIGHINNKDFLHKKTIKKLLPTLTTALAIATLALSTRNLHPLVSAGLCTTGLLATALTMPLPSLQSRGYSCFAVWLNNYIGEYRADSYALKHATITQLQRDKQLFEETLQMQNEYASKANLLDLYLDVHPSTSSRIKRIEKQIKNLENPKQR